jgi:polysaccharide export outer membrane protein
MENLSFQRVGIRRDVGRVVSILVSAGLIVCAWGTIVSAQPRIGEPDYRFRKGDTVRIIVPERPTLNKDLVVDQAGAITFPLLGVIPVEGLTAAEAHEKIFQALRDYYPSMEKLDFTVEGVPSVAVYVTGEVVKPGKYTFATPPKLWEAIREAGGPTGSAALDLVRIVKGGVAGAMPETVNVLAAIEQATTDSLPSLEDGDSVVLPSAKETYVGSQGVDVMGAVAKPGFYRLQGEHSDVMSVITMAGGLLPKAAVGDVKVVRKQPDGSTVTEELELDKYIDKGDPNYNPILRAGDTIMVPEQNAWGYQFKNNFGLILSVIATAATVLLVIDRMNNP